MSKRTHLAATLTTLVGLALMPIAGCGSSTPASFRVREEVTQLMKGAKKRGEEPRGDVRGKVTETIDRFFGSPTDLVVWERLPIDFGGHRAQVVVPDEDPDYDIRTAMKVTWLSPGKDDEADDLSIPAGTRAIYYPPTPAPKAEEAEKPAGDVAPEGEGAAEGEASGEDAAEEESPEPPEPVELVVAGYDRDKGLLVFDEALPVTAEAGGTVLVDPGAKLKYGKKLYLEHCMHCHGVTGDGNGPTARYLEPKPRDYRNGIFKFTSTGTPYKARRDDLARVIRNGVPGTYMPSFLLLSDEESEAIVEYVRWLASRGEIEKFLADNLLDAGFSQKAYEEANEKDREAAKKDGAKSKDGETKKTGREKLVDDAEDFLTNRNEFYNWTIVLTEAVDDKVVDKWTEAETEDVVIVPGVPRIDPEQDPESIARGRELFMGGKAKCVACHGPAGKGDGQQTRDFQMNTATKKPYPEPGLYDVWNNPIAPRNLTLGMYRGGRRPIDVYRRIKAGIKGTPMPAAAISDAEIWDLVNYVMSLPYDSTPAAAEKPSAETTAGGKSDEAADES